MFSITNLKKARTFYNKFVTSVKRNSLDIKIESFNNKLIHTIQFGKLGIRVLIQGDGNDFAPITCNFGDWYTKLDVDKTIKEIEVTYNNGLYFNGSFVNSMPSKSGNGSWIKLVEVDATVLNNSFYINAIVAGNGKLKVNSQTFFKFGHDGMKIINTNDIILQECVIPDIECEELILSIDNEYITNLKKWIMFANNMDFVNIYRLGNFIKFVAINDNITYEIIIPINADDSIKKTYYCLTSIIDRQYMGNKVILDETDMFQKSVEESIAMLLNSGKKIPKKKLKDELDKFTKNPDKLDAYKKLDKMIDVQYLNISNSIGDENIYILRTLYQNFISAISEFDYSIYYLNTKVNALMFGFRDEMFSFKTIFMLRKPKEVIPEINDVDLEVDESEEVIFVEDDTFEPT